MRKVRMLAYGVTVFVCVWGIGNSAARAQGGSQDARLALVDNCDPATFGDLCVVLPRPGDTTLTEFFALLFSTLSPTVVGHPAWHFQPGYLDVRAGHSLRVTNNGGEGHTFTEVAVFGGGSIPLLNGVGGPVGTSPLIRAPECPLNPAALAVVAPRATVVLNLPPGAHNFQCCIHPWMRAVVDIEEEED